MEALVVDESPLAAYLEGEGEADILNQLSKQEASDSPNPASSPSSSAWASRPESFAPRGFPTYLKKIANPPNAFRHLRSGPVSRIRNIYAFLVTSTLGSTDNERFLEHFRYIIIASQLLSDHSGQAPSKIKSQNSVYSSPIELPHIGTSLTGAGISAFTAFLLVYVLHWSRDATSGSFIVKRLLFAILLVAFAGVFLYAFVRRQWLKYLRRRAINAATAFVTSAQSFESVVSPVLAFIQEVELVSRGYQICKPLPPISRLEGTGQTRRCSRLRSHLSALYSSAIPALTIAVEDLRPHLNVMDLDRFMEVYDIHETDMEEAFCSIPELDAEDATSLTHLRVLDHRVSLLRRIFLCSLLSIPATGRKIDAVRWRTAITQLDGLVSLLDDLSNQTTEMLSNETEITNPQSVTQSRLSLMNGLGNRLSSSSPNLHIRRMTTLTTGIRSLQAKLYLLNEESTRSVSLSPSEADLSRLSASLREQYDSIGADLRALLQAWESGRQSLIEDISKQEHRMSLVSSSGRVSAPSLGGLTAVEEDWDSPEDQANQSASKSNRNSTMLSPRSAALRRLNGADGNTIPAPLSPPGTESGESEVEGGTASGRDEEVFEAVAGPPPPFRVRSELSREQRILKMHEDRERQRLLREKSELNTNMIRELQSVMRLRPPPAGKKADGSSSAGLAERQGSDAERDLKNEVPASPTHKPMRTETNMDNVMPEG